MLNENSGLVKKVIATGAVIALLATGAYGVNHYLESRNEAKNSEGKTSVGYEAPKASNILSNNGKSSYQIKEKK